MGVAVIVALCADLAWGEPQVRRHPIALIGRAMAAAARRLRAAGNGRTANKVAGAALVAGFSGTAFFSARGAILWMSARHPWAGVLTEAAFIWMSVSVGQLVKTARQVDVLAEDDPPAARALLKSLVGRDTAGLNPAQMRSAAVESVAENLVDAGTAPILYALLGGGALAFTYRVINTLDSMFGYKTAEYIDFGWAAARLDDLATWLPARLTVPLISLAGLVTGGRGAGAMRIAWTHGRRHASPNSGLAMAAVAGALNITLGGSRSYEGTQVSYGSFGDGDRPIGSDVVRGAGRLAKIAILMAGCATVLAAQWLKGPVWPVS